MIQHLLREAGGEGIDNELVSVTPDGFEAQADWTNLGSPETYLGYGQGQNLDSPGGVAYEEPRRALRYTEAAHPCRRHRPGRDVPALPRRPRREFQRGGDSRDRRRRRQ